MAYMGELPACTSIGTPESSAPLAARATKEKNRFDGGDGVEETSNAVAAVEAGERHAAGANFTAPN